jgi:predicted secreted hydrolase
LEGYLTTILHPASQKKKICLWLQQVYFEQTIVKETKKRHSFTKNCTREGVGKNGGERFGSGMSEKGFIEQGKKTRFD